MAFTGQVSISAATDQAVKLIPIEDLPDTTCLTRRQREIYDLLGHGMDKHMIAAELGIHVKTVETHRELIKSKLGVGNGRELNRYAVSAAIHKAQTEGAK
jgi:DNA-binding NarL/FixJ family response regulator